MKRIALAPRPDWRNKAQELGFIYHTPDGSPYWDESAAYQFSLRQIEDDIETPTGELEDLALAFVDWAVRKEEVLVKLGIPRSMWDVIANSWKRRDRHLYGRFDLSYSGTGPAKLLEYNADTPTALFETAVFQWGWLEDQIAANVLEADADQFNSLHDKLVAALRDYRNGTPYRLHLASMRDSEEDRGNVAYLEACAVEAGLTTRFLYIDEIAHAGGRDFVDPDGESIQTIFKLYPWEWMFNDEFSQHLPETTTRFIEPAWKALLSNKGCLNYFWQMEPGHPNLLACYFVGEERDDLGSDYVEKPLLSREGANVSIYRDGQIIAKTEGRYEGARIRQAYHPLPNGGNGNALIGSWVVAGEPCGLILREDTALITGNLSRVLPHFISA